jgi:hypothetical protein
MANVVPGHYYNSAPFMPQVPERYYNSMQKMCKLELFLQIWISRYFLLIFVTRTSNFQVHMKTFWLRPERVVNVFKR